MSFPRSSYEWSWLKILSNLLFLLSILGFGTSIVLTCWSYLLKIQVGDYLELALPGEGYLWPADVGLTVIFVAPVHLFGLSLRGYVVKDFTNRRALRKSPNNGKNLDRLLFLHVVLSCLSGFLVFGACSGGTYYWNYSRRRVKQGLYSALRRYPNDRETKLRFDRMQIELRCCGSEFYTDWFLVPWNKVMETKEEIVEEDVDEDEDLMAYVDRKSIDHNVPYSCCTPDILRACIHEALDDDYQPEEYRRIQSTISINGCQSKLLEKTDDAARDTIACLLFISVYQLTVSLVSRLLQTTRLSAIRANVKGESFDGWIFGSDKSQYITRPQEYQPLQQSSARQKSSVVRKRSPSTCNQSLVIGLANEPSSRRQRHQVEPSILPPCMQIRRYYSEDDENDQKDRLRDSSSTSSSQDSSMALGIRAPDDEVSWNRANTCDMSSSSSVLPPLPSTPRRNLLPSTQFKTDESQPCPIHYSNCPVHSKSQDRFCPVHGDRVRR